MAAATRPKARGLPRGLPGGLPRGLTPQGSDPVVRCAPLASPPPPPPPPPPPWTRAALAGGVAEISSANGGGTLSLAMALVLDAQREGEPVAWVAAGEGTFFPPDAAAAGVDLGALPVVLAPAVAEALRAADLLLRSGAFGLVILDLGGSDGAPGARWWGDPSARRLPALRPGEWECGERLPGAPGPRELDADIPGMMRASSRSRAPRGRPPGEPWTPSVTARLAGLARRHGATLLCIAGGDAAAGHGGSLATLRAEALLRRTGEGQFRGRVRALRDRRRPLGWVHEVDLRGPDGLG